MGNQQSPQIKNRPLSSNKILIIGKGIYNVELPEIHNKQILQALKEGLPKFIRLQIYLKDASKCNLQNYVIVIEITIYFSI